MELSEAPELQDDDFLEERGLEWKEVEICQHTTSNLFDFDVPASTGFPVDDR